MLKRIMLVLAIVVLIAPMSARGCITGWILGTPTEMDNPEAEFRAMLGLKMEDEAQVGPADIGTPEFGVQYDWLGSDGDFDRWGVYGLLHLGDQSAADTWIGRPFIGANFGLDVQGNDGNGTTYGGVAGTVYAKIFVLMYQFTKYDGQLEAKMAEWQDEHKAFAGLCLRY